MALILVAIPFTSAFVTNLLIAGRHLKGNSLFGTDLCRAAILKFLILNISWHIDNTLKLSRQFSRTESVHRKPRLCILLTFPCSPCLGVFAAFLLIILIFCSVRRGIHDMFPLHLAVLFGFSDCCRKLLSSGILETCPCLSSYCSMCVHKKPWSLYVCAFESIANNS